MSSENIRIFHTTKQNSLLNIINETLNQCRPENNTISDATADDDDSESFFFSISFILQNVRDDFHSTAAKSSRWR